jgi:hypothetical protein
LRITTQAFLPTPWPDSADIAIGFTGPWVNVFYEQTVANTEIRGVRQPWPTYE